MKTLLKGLKTLYNNNPPMPKYTLVFNDTLPFRLYLYIL